MIHFRLLMIADVKLEREALQSYSSSLLGFLDDTVPVSPPPKRTVAKRKRPSQARPRKQSGVKGVNWFEFGWRAKWYENGKLCSKLFHEKDHGEVGALREAINLRFEMEASGRAAVKSIAKNSGVSGVCWDRIQRRWRASVHVNGKRRIKYFPVSRNQSEEQALYAAIHWKESQKSISLEALVI